MRLGWGSPLPILQVDAFHITITQHFQRLSGDAPLQVLLHSFAFGYHVGGTGTGEFVGPYQNLSNQTRGSGPHQPREGVYPHRHSGHLGCHHTEQSCLRGHRMHHVGLLLPQHPN